MFAKISRPTPEEEVYGNWARREGVYTTKDMRSSPKRHTPTLRNRCAGTTQAMLTTPKVCMLTSKATCTYTKKYMNIYKEVHAHTQRSICLRPRSGNACFKKHANTPREQMPLNMEVHAHTPRSTCTNIKEYIHLYERNTCTYTKKYMRLA